MEMEEGKQKIIVDLPDSRMIGVVRYSKKIRVPVKRGGRDVPKYYIHSVGYIVITT